MGRSRRQRAQKSCEVCQLTAMTLFRIKTAVKPNWHFACPKCQRGLKNMTGYQYGGTWQSEKRN